MCIHDHHNHSVKVEKPEVTAMLSKRRFIQAVAAGGVVSIAAPALSGCSTNPETGARQLVAFGDAQLSQMAAQSWAEAKQAQPVSTDPRYTNRLKNIGSRIAVGANKGKESWDYAVFDTDTKNAFVLPGNRVGFYKGMMDFTDNDDQIAAIMGHEVGHVTGRHAAERMTMDMAGQVAVIGGSVLGASQLSKSCNKYTNVNDRNACLSGANQKAAMLNQALGLGFMLGVSLPYSRSHESMSDLLGAKYMYRSGYDPYQAVSLWEKMAEASPSRQPEFLSTHPDPSNRARDLHNYIKCQERLGSQGWQSMTIKDELKACQTTA
jgi:predicted Zn-dependent protease